MRGGRRRFHREQCAVGPGRLPLAESAGPLFIQRFFHHREHDFAAYVQTGIVIVVGWIVRVARDAKPGKHYFAGKGFLSG